MQSSSRDKGLQETTTLGESSAEGDSGACLTLW